MRVRAAFRRTTIMLAAVSLLVAAPTVAASADEGYPMSENVYVHDEPSMSKDSRIGKAWRGERVEILCQQTGPDVKGNNVWDFVQYRLDGTTEMKRGFVSDFYVRTGVVGALPGVPFGNCAPTPFAFCTSGGGLTAVDLAHRWKDGRGGCFKFVDGDHVTEQLRNDPWLQEVTQWLARNGEGGEEPNRTPEGFFAGTRSKSLKFGLEFARAAERDPGNYWAAARDRRDTGDMAISYLGSYYLRYRVVTLPNGSDIEITYNIYNTTDIESATRIPFVGYFGVGLDDDDPLVKWVESRFIPKQYQHIRMTFVLPRHFGIACEVSGGYCPPAQDDSI